MKSLSLGICFFALLLAALPGCGSNKAKTEETGPRVTSGNVDESVKPMKPSVGGGAVAPPK